MSNYIFVTFVQMLPVIIFEKPDICVSLSGNKFWELFTYFTPFFYSFIQFTYDGSQNQLL